MGKQHFSDNKPGRRGPGRPTTDRNERGGSAPRGNAGGYGDRPDRGARRDDRPERGRSEGYSSARPAFGQGGRPGGSGGDSRRSFGGERPAGSGQRQANGGQRDNRGERPAYGSNSRPGYGGGQRPAYGQRDERPTYGNQRDERPRRPEGERPAYGGQRDERPRRAEGERPSYGGEERPKKSIWQGQPVRYEGKPTVPRGTAGERNRKFIKKDPSAPAADSAATPAYQGRNERQAWEDRGSEQRGSQTGKPRFEGGRGEEGPRRSYDSGREGGPRPDRGSYREERRPGGERRENSGADRRSGGSEAGGYRERREGSAGKPRSFGEQPGTGSGTFRERRDAMRDQVRGGRNSGTTYGRTDQPGQAPDYKNLKHYEQDKNRGNKRRREDEDFGTEEMRLNRYIANAGICSRREADALIAAGEIRVNGEVVTEMGYKVQPSDTVQYGKTNLNREKLVYVLLNKPKDYITTTDDPEGRKTVMDLVANSSKERIFPVGRLDRNTTGLLLFTNDGEVAQKLSHPSHKNKKIYQVELDKPLTAEHLRQISEGVELEDGKAEVDDIAVVAGNPHFVGVELHIGRNRIVRRIFEHLGYDVIALDRVQYAGITKKDLPRGKWRFLSEQEVIRLKYFM
ncbi:MAG: pseudouridine synthase [Hymenobacter sp.]|nr:MAG: pseudouridine synthase [Hymenobacter sp.]